MGEKPGIQDEAGANLREEVRPATAVPPARPTPTEATPAGIAVSDPGVPGRTMSGGGGGLSGDHAEAPNLNSSKSNVYRSGDVPAGAGSGPVGPGEPAEAASFNSSKSNRIGEVETTAEGDAGDTGESERAANLNLSKSNINREAEPPPGGERKADPGRPPESR